MSDLSVEEAPGAMDLDELLGISDEDLEESSSSVEVSNDDNIPIDEPHIKIPTKKLIEILKVSGMISSAGENSFEGKMVVIKVTEGKATFLLSDNKRNIEQSVALLNDENQFEGLVAFSTSLLARLSKVCTSIFTLIKRVEHDEHSDSDVDKFVLKIRGGEIYLDNIKVQEDKFVKDFSDDTYKTYSKNEVITVIKRLYTFAGSSIKTGKNLDFIGNVVQATPIGAVAKFYVDGDYPEFKISLTDARILHTLCLCDDGSDIKINKDGKMFCGDTFNYKTESFPAQKCVFDDVVDEMLSGESAIVDVQHIAQIADLSVGLDTSTGLLRFNYTDEGRVSCTLLTKRSNSELIIQGTSNESLVKMENAVDIQASILKSAMTIYSQETTLVMRVSKNGISLESGNVKVVILGKTATK